MSTAKWANTDVPEPARFRAALRCDRSLRASYKAVLITLAEHYPEIRVTVETLAAESGYRARTVHDALKAGREGGWIVRTRKGNHLAKRSAEYKLLMRGPGSAPVKPAPGAILKAAGGSVRVAPRAILKSDELNICPQELHQLPNNKTNYYVVSGDRAEPPTETKEMRGPGTPLPGPPPGPYEGDRDLSGGQQSVGMVHMGLSPDDEVELVTLASYQKFSGECDQRYVHWFPVGTVTDLDPLFDHSRQMARMRISLGRLNEVLVSHGGKPYPVQSWMRPAYATG